MLVLSKTSRKGEESRGKRDSRNKEIGALTFDLQKRFETQRGAEQRGSPRGIWSGKGKGVPVWVVGNGWARID